MAVKIIADTNTDHLQIDATSQAARIIRYASATGQACNGKSTYRAATTAPFVAANSTSPFFLIYGSQDKLLIVQRITITGMTLAGTTAVGYLAVVVQKFATIPTAAGTSTLLIQTPLDTNYLPASATLCAVYTAAPTAGTLIGTIGTKRNMGQANNALATGPFDFPMEWDFRTLQSENCASQLRSGQRGLGLAFTAAPGVAITLGLEVEWTEE